MALPVLIVVDRDACRSIPPFAAMYSHNAPLKRNDLALPPADYPNAIYL